jgi:hypothetical protein
MDYALDLRLLLRMGEATSALDLRLLPEKFST